MESLKFNKENVCLSQAYDQTYGTLLDTAQCLPSADLEMSTVAEIIHFMWSRLTKMYWDKHPLSSYTVTVYCVQIDLFFYLLKSEIRCSDQAVKTFVWSHWRITQTKMAEGKTEHPLSYELHKPNKFKYISLTGLFSTMQKMTIVVSSSPYLVLGTCKVVFYDRATRLQYLCSIQARWFGIFYSSLVESLLMCASYLHHFWTLTFVSHIIGKLNCACTELMGSAQC